LILILHKLPIAGSSQRELGMFWRSSDGTWKSNELGGGIQALQQHVNEYGNRALELEDMENKAVAADDFFYVRNEIPPVHRAAKNMFAAISRTYEVLPTDTKGGLRHYLGYVLENSWSNFFHVAFSRFGAKRGFRFPHQEDKVL